MSSSSHSLLFWIIGIVLVVVIGSYLLTKDDSPWQDFVPSPTASVSAPDRSSAPTPTPAANGYRPCSAQESANPGACTREYVPVCGANGITYSNRCSACANSATTGTKPGACPSPTPTPTTTAYTSCSSAEKATTACTREYLPHCGNDGVTYGNRCTACASASVTSAKPGECQGSLGQPSSPTCTALEKASSVCTLEYAPVCGNDGVTYGNRCMGCAAEGVTSVTQGECN